MTQASGKAAGIAPQTREIVERIIQAVDDGDDRRVRALLDALAEVADTAALLYLRERLYQGQQD
ncbi:hypothetical protein [Streptomyces sp. NPDC054797]